MSGLLYNLQTFHESLINQLISADIKNTLRGPQPRAAAQSTWAPLLHAAEEQYI